MTSSVFLLPSVNPLATNSNPYLATGHQDGTLRYWTYSCGDNKPAFSCTIRVQAHDKPVVHIGGFEKCFATATLHGQFAVWKFSTGQRDKVDLLTLFKDHALLSTVDLQVTFISATS